MRRICGCRYCWIDGGTRACGSVKDGRSAGFVINKFFKCFIISGGGNSPLRRPLRAPCRMHWELRKRWYKSHPQNNGSTSFSLTSGHPRQTSCSTQKVRTRYVLVSICWFHFFFKAPPYSPEVQLFAGELFFNDTSCFDSRSQYILLSRKIVRLTDSVHFIEVADGGRTNRNSNHASDMKSSLYINTKLPLRFYIVSVPVADMDSLASRVVQLVLSSSLKGGLHTRIFPQLLDDISQLRRHCTFLDGVWQVLQLLCILLQKNRDLFAPAQSFYWIYLTFYVSEY